MRGQVLRVHHRLGGVRGEKRNRNDSSSSIESQRTLHFCWRAVCLSGAGLGRSSRFGDGIGIARGGFAPND